MAIKRVPDLIYSSKKDAEDVLYNLNCIIRSCGFASIVDLYGLSGISNCNYNDDVFGWIDIIRISPELMAEGYILRLPKPVHFCKKKINNGGKNHE